MTGRTSSCAENGRNGARPVWYNSHMKGDSKTVFTLGEIAAYGAGFALMAVVCAYFMALFFQTGGSGQASAATFDSPLAPATSSPSALDIGSGSAKWRSIYLSQNLNLDGKIAWMSASTTAGGGPATNNSIGMLKQGSIGVGFTNIAAGTVQTITIASTTIPELLGIRAGDRIFMTPPPALNDNIIFAGARALTDSIEVKVKDMRTSGSALTGSNNWSYLIIR